MDIPFLGKPIIDNNRHRSVITQVIIYYFKVIPPHYFTDYWILDTDYRILTTVNCLLPTSAAGRLKCLRIYHLNLSPKVLVLINELLVKGVVEVFFLFFGAVENEDH